MKPERRSGKETEIDPFKHNSWPMNTSVQAWQMTQQVEQRLVEIVSSRSPCEGRAVQDWGRRSPQEFVTVIREEGAVYLAFEHREGIDVDDRGLEARRLPFEESNHAHEPFRLLGGQPQVVGPRFFVQALGQNSAHGLAVAENYQFDVLEFPSLNCGDFAAPDVTVVIL